MNDELTMRRRLLLGGAGAAVLPLLPGCAQPLPVSLNTTITPAARALLQASAQAHGLSAWAGIADVSVRYEGQWRALIGQIQPALADTGFRGESQERLLVREGVVAQSYRGASGRKQVLRRDADAGPGGVRVWFNGEEARDAERRAAAALVADGYALFLLGPLWLQQRWLVQRTLTMELGGVESVGAFECDVLRVRAAPGLGFAESDRLALLIDREVQLMRAVRFTLDGLPATAGAIAQVETFDHVSVGGVRWPTRFQERLLRPAPLPVHDWRLTGLDLDRGLTVSDVDGPDWAARAAAPAAPLPAAP